MRTNIVLDEKLVRAAMKLSGAKTKREAVHIALERLVKGESARQARILELEGQCLLDPAYDVRAVRASMNRDPR